MPTYAPVEPDVIGGMIAYLRAASPLTTYLITNGEQRVSAALSRRWTSMPNYAIVLHPAGGPPGIDGTSLDRARLDFFCYGPGDTYDTQARTATELYRVLKPFLCPPGGMRIPRAFRVASAGLAVWDVFQSSKPRVAPDPDTQWAVNISSFIFLYGTLPG